jgi:hypothetical protein
MQRPRHRTAVATPQPDSPASPAGVEQAANRLRPGRAVQHRAGSPAGAAVEPARRVGDLRPPRPPGDRQRGRLHRRPGRQRSARPGRCVATRPWRFSAASGLRQRARPSCPRPLRNRLSTCADAVPPGGSQRTARPPLPMRSGASARRSTIMRCRRFHRRVARAAGLSPRATSPAAVRPAVVLALAAAGGVGMFAAVPADAAGAPTPAAATSVASCPAASGTRMTCMSVRRTDVAVKARLAAGAVPVRVRSRRPAERLQTAGFLRSRQYGRHRRRVRRPGCRG